MAFLPFDLSPSWAKALAPELEKPYIVHLKAFLEQERWAGRVIYPKEEHVFSALNLVPLASVRVVIVGQDPYHAPGQAHGLSFSVPPGIQIPPSLQNIYKELEQDLGITPARHGCLVHWAKQGVLLLNAILTVRQGEPLSHAKKGWEEFTDAVVEAIAMQSKHVVFMLWGKNAQEKCLKFSPVLSASHLVLQAAHPSPFSASHGFLGCRHFSKANEYLLLHGQPTIQWQLPA